MIKINDKEVYSVLSTEQEIDKIMKGTLKVYEGFKNLIASGVPPLTLNKCKGADLIDYKIYGNSVQNGTPTPETPIEIESVGDKTKNVYNYKEYPLTKGTYITYKTGIAPAYNPSSNYACTLGFVPIEPNTTYTLNYASGGNNPGIAFYSEANEDSYISGIKSNIGFTTPDGANFVRFTVPRNTDETTIQLEKGTSITECVPYGYKIPVKVGRKNLIDVEEVTKEAISQTVQLYRFDNINLKAGTYTFSSEVEITDYEEDMNNGSLSYGYRVDGGAIKYGTFIRFYTYAEHSSEKSYRYSFNFTADGTLTFFYVYINSGTSKGKVTLRNAMLTINDTDLTYEPYVEPITTNIYLNEPLRKVGDYADYIDFENQKVVRQLKYLRLTSALDWISASSGGYPYKYCTVSDIAKGVPDKMFMCNTYEITQRNVSRDDDRICYRLNYNGFFVTDSTYISVNSFNEMLDANNVYVIYPTNQKEGTIELPNIPTLKGTTILEVDTEIQPSNMEVIYKGK